MAVKLKWRLTTFLVILGSATAVGAVVGGVAGNLKGSKQQ